MGGTELVMLAFERVMAVVDKAKRVANSDAVNNDICSLLYWRYMSMPSAINGW